MWKRKNADQRVKRSFKTADEVLKVRVELLSKLAPWLGWLDCT
jgi:hypothetical protein